MTYRIAIAILLCAMLAFAQTTTLTNAMVINMVRSGIPDDVIIKTIAGADHVNFQFLPGDLQLFQQYKVSDDVVRVMAAKDNGRPIPADIAGRVGLAPASAPASKSASPPSAARPVQNPQPNAPASGREPRPNSEFRRGELFGGYSYLNADFNNLIPRQSLNGWEASISVNANRWFAGEGDVSGWYRNGVSGITSLNVHDHAFLGGPRVNLRPVFVHALFGVDRLGGSVLGVSLGAQNSFAAAFGGGVEVKFSRNWAARVSADYALTRHNIVGPERVTQDHFRFGGGVVYAFGH